MAKGRREEMDGQVNAWIGVDFKKEKQVRGGFDSI